MTGDNDGLIDHLLFSVALTGSHGLGAADFTRRVVEYHQSRIEEEDAPRDHQTQDLFLSAKPPRQTLTIDSKYLESTWAWITSQRDISQRLDDHEQVLPGPPKPSTDEAETIRQREFLEHHCHDRIYTTEDRIWQTVAGHGVDWKKLPKLEFQCLCVIAAHGKDGIIQPDVVALTGQDKRSVPKRTDSLAGKGYITKETVQGSGTKTSLLRLRRFLTEATDSGPIVRLSSSTARIRDAENLTPIIRYEQWFAIIMRQLKENAGIVSYDHIRKATGVINHRLSTRALNRFTWRLTETGLIDRLYAMPNVVDATGTMEEASRNKPRPVRCLKLLREPSRVDRDAFMTSLKKDSLYGRSTLPIEAEDEVDDIAGDEGKLDSHLGATGVPQGSILSISPVWSLDKPTVNIIFDIIESFGARGASSTEVCDIIGSSLWRKPFDDLVARLTDQWNKVQPPHLRHFSIIRDTRIQGTITHYTFRTLKYFQKAVDCGQASWVYVLRDKSMIDTLTKQPELDEWGFPIIPPSEFFGSDPGVAIAQCAQDKLLLVDRHKSRIDEQVLHQHDLAKGQETGRAPTPVNRSSAKGPKKKRARRESKKNGAPTAFVLKKTKWLERYRDLQEAWIARSRALALFLVRQELHQETSEQGARKRIKTLTGTTPTQNDPITYYSSVHPDHETVGSGAVTAHLPAHAAETATSKMDVPSPSDEPDAAEPAEPERRSRKRQRPLSNDTEMPEDRVNDLSQEIISLSRPGIYIDEPRAVLIHRDLITSKGKGRPKNGCVLTFRSTKLHQFSWFTFDLTARPSSNLLEFVPTLAEDPHVRVEAEDAGMLVDNDNNQTPSAEPEADLVADEVTPLDMPGGGSLEPQDQLETSRDQYTSQEGRSTAEHHYTMDDANGEDLLMHDIVSDEATDPSTHCNADLKPKELQQHQAVPDGQALGTPRLLPEHTMYIADNPEQRESAEDETHRVPIQDDAGELGLAQATQERRMKTGTPGKQLTAAEVSAGLGMFDMVNQTSGSRKHPRAPRRQGVTRTGGLVEYQRAKLVLDIVSQCGGVFPGRAELYYPFASLWQQRFGQVPDRHTLARSLKSLLASSKLIKITFAFKSLEGFPVIKTMLTEPQIDPTGFFAKQLQHQMEVSWPAIYLPPEAPLTKEIRRRFEERKKAATQGATLFRNFKPSVRRDTSANDQQTRPHVKLGMTEEQIAEGAERRRQQRKIEARREAELKWLDQNALDEEAQHMVSEFQLDSYRFTPEARVDRGPHGKKQYTRLIKLGEVEKPKRGPSLGTLQSMKEKRKRNAASLASTSRLHTALTKRLAFRLTLEDPQQLFHQSTGTFATIPIQFTAPDLVHFRPTPVFRPLWPRPDDPLPIPDGDAGGALDARQRLVTYSSFNTRENQKKARREDVGEVDKEEDETNKFFRRKVMPKKTVGTQSTSKRMARTRIGTMTGVIIRDPTEDVPMTAKDQTRLLHAMAVVTTLAGGLQQGPRVANFAIVNQCMHFKFDGKYCREHWNHIKSKHAAHVEQLQNRFRKIFLRAYERNEIPEMHMATPEKIDWAYLVDWFETKLSGPSVDSGLLPDTREEFDAQHAIDFSQGMYRADQEGFYGPNVSSVRKDDVINNCGFFDPLPSTFDAYDTKKRKSDQYDMVAQSWIRANSVTPTEYWDGVAAHRKLDLIAPAILDSSMDTLLGQQIIKGAIRGDKGKARNLEGRDFIIADALDIIFPLPRHWDLVLFTAATSFKQRLDTTFASEGVYELRADSPHCNAETMAVLNLVDHGRIEIDVHLPQQHPDPSSDRPVLSKWGFTRGDYKTMAIDRGKLIFPLSVRPTPTYLAGVLRDFSLDPAAAPVVAVPIPCAKAFPGDPTPGERLPFWATIHGGLIPENFRALLLTFLYLLTQRPGCDARGVVKALKARFWEWEVQMLGEWAEEAGLVVADGGGWTLAEWWWLAGGVVKGLGVVT